MKDLEAAFSWHNQENAFWLLETFGQIWKSSDLCFLVTDMQSDKLIAVVVLLQVSANPF
jgi:hypothetical protein